jgi:hypothetical protein
MEFDIRKLQPNPQGRCLFWEGDGMAFARGRSTVFGSGISIAKCDTVQKRLRQKTIVVKRLG